MLSVAVVVDYKALPFLGVCWYRTTVWKIFWMVLVDRRATSRKVFGESASFARQLPSSRGLFIFALGNGVLM